MLITKKIVVKWNPYTKKHYESKGYVYTKTGNEFEVLIEHLLKSSNVKIEYECDYCHKTFPKIYSNYMQSKDNDIINTDSCKKCYMKIKRIEEFTYKQNMGLLNKGMPFYWYFRENRIKELELYLKKYGHINNITKKSDEGYIIYCNFERYNDSLETAVEELGYNLDKVKERKTRGYYYDFEKVEKKIETFIKLNNRFPSKEDLKYNLKIDNRIIVKHGGINGIKKKMNYSDESDLIDDRGFYNKSLFEFYTAQFLIHNNIPYKREQHPFPKHEGNYRSDFTFYFDNEELIHCEIWGFKKHNNDKLLKSYLKTKTKKINLYKKHNIKLISIDEDIFVNNNYKDIQSNLYEIFKLYLNLKYKNIDINYFKLPKKMTDEEILQRLLEISDNSKILPTVQLLSENNNIGLYLEIMKRYESYLEFANRFGKELKTMKYKWDENLIFTLFTEIAQQSKVIDKSSMNELSSTLKVQVQKFGGIVDLKLKFFNFYLKNNDNNIIEDEIKWLKRVENGVANTKSIITDDNIKSAKYLLNSYFN